MKSKIPNDNNLASALGLTLDEFDAVELAKVNGNKIHDDVNATYGEEKHNYSYHTDRVADRVFAIRKIFLDQEDWIDTVQGGHYHDSIEDGNKSFNDIMRMSSINVARIVLGVTDTEAENRFMKHMLTMPKTIQDYRAILLKMCDLYENALYSKSSVGSMYRKYCQEYEYRRPIFKRALRLWYSHKVNIIELENFWKELDSIHKFKK
jgi:(p)ppGpp synthase/HD superfamily hydrolase